MVMMNEETKEALTTKRWRCEHCGNSLWRIYVQNNVITLVQCHKCKKTRGARIEVVNNG